MSISIRTIYIFLIFFTENLIKYLIIFPKNNSKSYNLTATHCFSLYKIYYTINAIIRQAFGAIKKPHKAVFKIYYLLFKRFNSSIEIVRVCFVCDHSVLFLPIIP